MAIYWKKKFILPKKVGGPEIGRSTRAKKWAGRCPPGPIGSAANDPRCHIKHSSLWLPETNKRCLCCLPVSYFKLSPYLRRRLRIGHCRKIWRHPRNRKCIIYCNATEPRQGVACTKMWCGSGDMLANRQTHRQIFHSKKQSKCDYERR